MTVLWPLQAEFGERVGYLNEYSNANPSEAKVDDLDTTVLTLSQRLVLVGLRQDKEMWAKLDSRRSRRANRRAASTVQTAIINLLDGTRLPGALSMQERTAVNMAMQSELKEVVGFSPLDATGAEITHAQVSPARHQSCVRTQPMPSNRGGLQGLRGQLRARVCVCVCV